MAELYQDLMIQEQEENERKRRILLEQEEKLAAEILRYNFTRSLVNSLFHSITTYVFVSMSMNSTVSTYYLSPSITLTIQSA
jgi:Mg2+/Co2+ transporter CorB